MTARIFHENGLRVGSSVSAADFGPGPRRYVGRQGQEGILWQLDGEYVKKLSLGMDFKCFLGSVGVFAKDDSVVEGGTGEMKKQEKSR